MSLSNTYKLHYYVKLIFVLFNNFLPERLFIPALRMSCELDVECLPNAVCVSNATSTNKRLKICMCKEDFTEENEMCNCNSFYY